MENLCHLTLDHSPILLRCKSVYVERHDRPFQFLAAWSSHDGFEAVVRKAWDEGHHSVIQRLDRVGEESLVFNRDVFGNIFRKKRTLEVRLRGIQWILEKVDVLSLLY